MRIHFPFNVRPQIVRAACAWSLPAVFTTFIVAYPVLPVTAQKSGKPKAGTKAPVKAPPKLPSGTQIKTAVALPTQSVSIPGAAVKLTMVQAPAGSITVAAPGGKGDPRKVELKSFWIATTETPWEIYDAFIASGMPSPPYDQTEFPPDAIARPSKSYIPPDMGWGHKGWPVISESFLSADMFCRWLAKATGKKFRLPTEAEWEYACRAGAAGPWKMTAADLEKVAWHKGNSNRKSHPVAKKAPNAWGLYDMLGNAGEWATDTDGKPVLCGGAWSDAPDKITPGLRAYFVPAWQATDPQLPKSRWWLSDAQFAGFRLVCEL